MANSEQSENPLVQRPRLRESARARSVVDRLVSALGRDIVGGVWKPDETLPTEPEIAHRFGAGRNAVREAVKILAAKGFVRTERRAGTIVRPESCWNLLDPEVLSWMLSASANRDHLLDELSELRSIIEPAVAAWPPPTLPPWKRYEFSKPTIRWKSSVTKSKRPSTRTLHSTNCFSKRVTTGFLIALVPAFSLLAANEL